VGIRITLLALTVLVGCGSSKLPKYRDGDIIFHTSQSSQSEALRRAMKSPYTHMGVIFIENGTPVVYEAVGPVKRTPLEEWIRRGQALGRGGPAPHAGDGHETQGSG
jgi:hypothetical protein